MKGSIAAFVVSSILLCVVGTSTWGQDATPETKYDIRVSLDVENDTLVGTQEVTFVNTSAEPIHQLAFALIANWAAEANPYLHPALLDSQYTSGFDPTWTHVSRVTDADGNVLSTRLEAIAPILQTYSLDNGVLFVDLPSPLLEGEAVTVLMTFETKFARALLGDNCVYKGTYVWRFGWNPIAVGEDALEGAFVLPSAEYRVDLTIPESYQAYGGADHQQTLDTSSGLTTVQLSNDRPTRSVPLIIGPELQTVTTDWNGISLVAVYLPGGESYARESVSYAGEILAYHTEHFGALAKRRIVIGANPTPGFFGMAADGMILVGASLIQLKDMPALGVYDRLNEYLLAHELAHQWWGIGIGTDFNAENWISEGFAEFLAVTYFEDRYGAMDPNLLDHLQPGLIEDLVTETFGYLNLRHQMEELPYLALLRLGFDEPIVEPLADSEYLNGLSIRTYNKGYLVLRGLQALIGSEAMHQLLMTAHDEWDGRVLTVDALESLAEGISAQDLTAYFDEWIHGTAQSDAAIADVDIEDSAGSHIAHVAIDGVNDVFPVIVEATLEDGTQLRRKLDPGSSPALVVFEADRPFTTFTVDPDEMLPDANRYNNHWPRKIVVSYPFQPEDAPPLGVPLDAYAIRISSFGISGGFRNDHAWSLMFLPHISEEDWMSLDGFDVQQPLFDLFGVFAANVGRDLALSFTGSLSAWDLSTRRGDLEAALSVRILGFTHPQTGNAGQYWYPTWQQTLTLGAIGAVSHPIPYASLSILRDDTPTGYMTNRVTVQAGVPGFGTDPFGTIEWRGAKRFRLSPLFYVDVAVSASETLFHDLPDEFLFSLDMLHAFDYLPMGHHQVSASLEVIFPPLVRDDGYAILNLTRLDSVTASAFIQGGRTQANCTTVCEPGIRWETGVKLTLSFPGFLGETLSFSIGYAYPLTGIDGESRFFLEMAGM